MNVKIYERIKCEKPKRFIHLSNRESGLNLGVSDLKMSPKKPHECSSSSSFKGTNPLVQAHAYLCLYIDKILIREYNKNKINQQ